MTKKFKGTSSVAMTSNPRLVDSSFQCRSVYQPIPNKDPVIKAKITNGANGIFSNLPVVHRLITSAMEQPTINNPPSSSPQKMLRCSMNEANTSRRERRGRAGGAAGTETGAGVGWGKTTGCSACEGVSAAFKRIGSATASIARGLATGAVSTG